MKNFLILQRLDPPDTNLGALYINIQDISVIFVTKSNHYGKELRLCNIVLNNGLVYIPVQSVSEVIDEIERIQSL